MGSTSDTIASGYCFLMKVEGKTFATNTFTCYSSQLKKLVTKKTRNSIGLQQFVRKNQAQLYLNQSHLPANAILSRILTKFRCHILKFLKNTLIDCKSNLINSIFYLLFSQIHLHICYYLFNLF